jgi:hypothetical protein
LGGNFAGGSKFRNLSADDPRKLQVAKVAKVAKARPYLDLPLVKTAHLPFGLWSRKPERTGLRGQDFIM